MIRLSKGSIKATKLTCCGLSALVVRDYQSFSVLLARLKDRTLNSDFKNVALGSCFAIQLTNPPGILWMRCLYCDQVARSDWVERQTAEILHSVLTRESIRRISTVQG